MFYWNRFKIILDPPAGKIYKNKNSDSIQYQVSSVKDLQLIQKHFDKYPLHTKKRADFEL